MGNLLDIFAEQMNFEYELVRPPDSLWGIKLDNGSWNGMMGLVHRNEVEFALGPFAVTPQRADAIDFSVAVHSDNQAIITVRPGIQKDMKAFLKPFTMEVWLLIILSLVTICIAMVLLEVREGQIFGFTTRRVVAKAVMWMLQTLTRENPKWLPKWDGCRLIVITWILVSFVFTTCYSGILTAMLTVPRVTIPIDSLSDLVAQHRLPWRLESGAIMLTYLQESDDKVRRKAFSKMSGTISDCWSSRQSIASGKFSAICDETTMKKAISWDFSTTGQCHLYIAREKVYSNLMMCLAFKINSTYLEKANKIIMRVKESGLLEQWMRTEITNTSQCLRPPSSDQRDGRSALSLEALIGPFLVLAAGDK
ncbi:glutamate receptor ionotropic, kainate glr-3-like [Cherax quadricarinatus]|uniref:glutamate receptor ionotropic, kainate glr-3-like n=1 Tax=Cherax quadricarinatus TaxID=27406 RepID=UPI00387E49D3